MTPRPAWNKRTTPLPEPHLARLQRRMAKGQSLEEAAEAVGLTLPLAKSVFIRSGLPVPGPVRRRRAADAVALQELGKKVHHHLRRVDSAPAAEVAAALGVTTAQVRAAIWDEDRHRLLRRPTARERYSDTAILIGLQLMAFERGRACSLRGPAPVSAAYWDEHRDPAAHPRSSEVKARFGTWLEACRAAGIPQRNHVKALGPSRRWTDEQLVACLDEFFASGIGESPAAFQEWTVTRPEAPALGTILHRLGRWTEVRDRFRG